MCHNHVADTLQNIGGANLGYGNKIQILVTAPPWGRGGGGETGPFATPSVHHWP